MHPTIRGALCAIALLGLGPASFGCATSDNTVTPPPPKEGGAEDVMPTGCGQLGQPCCAMDVCDTGSFCNEGTCKPQNPTDIGKPCATNADCQSGLCAYLTGLDGGLFDGGVGPASPTVCSTGCTSDSQCTAGWSCSQLVLGHGVCTCSPEPEQCDGKDDNCDGKIDEQPGANAWCTSQNGVPETCVNGACDCVTSCTGQCVDLTQDPNNCGKCGTTCTPTVEMCANSMCVCAATMCGANCVDTTTDPMNCGGCGTICGYTCSNSQCGPLQIATTSASGGLGIVSDGMNVYFVGGSFFAYSIEKCPAGMPGCSPTTVAANVSPTAFQGNLLATGGGFLYWPDGANVREAPLAMAMPTAATYSAGVAGTNAPYQIATDATSVYWSDDTSGKILKCALGATCATPTVVVTLVAGTDPQFLAVDATYVYWTDGNGSIFSHPLVGGSTVTLATSLFPNQILAAGGRLFWTIFGGPVYTCAGNATAATCPAPNGNVFASDTNAYGLATDGTSLYWTNQSPGAVRKCALGATCSTVTTLAAGLQFPQYITVDAMHTYWLDGMTTGQVFEFSK